MKKRNLIITALALFLEILLHAADPLKAGDNSCVIVANPGVNVSQISRRDIVGFFLKTKRFWPDGAPIRPVDWAEGQPARNYFLSKVLNKSENELSDYWISQKLATGNRPPITMNTAEEVCQLVATIPGSVSYLPPEFLEIKACSALKNLGTLHE